MNASSSPLASVDLVADAPAPARAAAQEFRAALADVRKAWHRTNLISLSNAGVMRQVRDGLRDAGAQQLVSLTLDVMGPIRPVDMRDYMGETVGKHRELLALVYQLALKAALRDRAAGQVVDLALVKALLENWIAAGRLEGADSAESRDSARIADLMAKDTRLQTSWGVRRKVEDVEPARVRLALLAPLAPALESLQVVAQLDEALIGVMAQKVDHSGAAEVGDVEDDEEASPGKAGWEPSTGARDELPKGRLARMFQGLRGGR